MSTVIPDTDEFLVERSGEVRRATINKLSNVTANLLESDLIMVNRYSDWWRWPARSFDSLLDTDYILVHRSSTAYKVTVADIKAALIPPGPMAKFSWNSATDSYTRNVVADRDISVQSKIRRCVMTNAGAVSYYLDADTSTNRMRTNWIRLVETTELSVPYTGTHGTEIPNTALRAKATVWASGNNYVKGDIVERAGNYFEAMSDHLSASANAPNYGSAATATLTTATTPVMVEIPMFSVSMKTANWYQHEFRMVLGEKTDDGFQVHPAFVRGNGTLRPNIYVSAYMSSGTGGANSNSGGSSVAGTTRVLARNTAVNRGAGWHVMSFWDYNAIQWLAMMEYEDLNSQRCIGLGAATGTTYVKTCGSSNARGNRCGQSNTTTSTAYISYRGIENIYGVAWQWMDGVVAQGTSIYTAQDPTKYADTITTDYTYLDSCTTGYTANVITNVKPSNIGLLADAVSGTSSNDSLKAHVGDGWWTTSDGSAAAGLHGGFCGGYAEGGDHYNGLFMKNFFYKATDNYGSIGTRLAYYPGG